MTFRIVAAGRVEYPKVGTVKMAVLLADELARERPGQYVTVERRYSRPSVWNPSAHMRWETVYGRNAGAQ